MSKNPIVISKNDILAANAIELNNIIKILKKSLVDYKHGDILLPEKISQVFDEKTQNRINCMPATLKKENVCGVKWVSVFPKNPGRIKNPNTPISNNKTITNIIKIIIFGLNSLFEINTCTKTNTPIKNSNSPVSILDK